MNVFFHETKTVPSDTVPASSRNNSLNVFPFNSCRYTNTREWLQNQCCQISPRLTLFAWRKRSKYIRSNTFAVRHKKWYLANQRSPIIFRISWYLFTKPEIIYNFRTIAGPASWTNLSVRRFWALLACRVDAVWDCWLNTWYKSTVWLIWLGCAYLEVENYEGLERLLVDDLQSENSLFSQQKM